MLEPMEIGYLGHASFKIRGKTATVVTDPYDERCGRFPGDLAADIVTVSHDHSDHNRLSRVKGRPFVISGPGEYEVRSVTVVGVASWHDDQQGRLRGPNTIYVLEIDEVKVCHLGDLGHLLDPGQLDQIGRTEVVLVPVGGVYTIDAKTAAMVVKQLAPAVVVPMHYQQKGLDHKTFGQLAGVDDFLAQMGATGSLLPQPKLVLVKDKLPEELQVVVLDRWPTSKSHPTR